MQKMDAKNLQNRCKNCRQLLKRNSKEIREIGTFLGKDVRRNMRIDYEGGNYE